MMEYGVLPDEWFKQDRLTRMMVTGGVVAKGALSAMEQHDKSEEQKMKAEAERKAKGH